MATATPTVSDLLAAQDAAEALIVLGWPVAPAGDDLELWRIGDFEMTDDDLIGLATRQGIQPAAGLVQQAMAREIPRVGGLRPKTEITDAEIEAATDAYMKDEGAPPFVFSSGHQIDVGRAIDMHPQAKKLLADETIAPGLRRTMVKTAVIMGFPVEG